MFLMAYADVEPAHLFRADEAWELVQNNWSSVDKLLKSSCLNLAYGLINPTCGSELAQTDVDSWVWSIGDVS